MEESSDEDNSRARSKGRLKDRITYVEYESSHDSDTESDGDDDNVGDHKEEIGSVLDYRKGKKGATGESSMHFEVLEHGDPNVILKTEDVEDQYLIKWNGCAHYKNTWESLQSLNNRPNNKPLKSIRKVQNYIDKINQRKKISSPQEVKSREIEVELDRKLLKTHLEPERIFAEKRNSDTDATVYYVKWKNLSYSESTWENAELLKSYYPSFLENYATRKTASSTPVNRKHIVNLIRKGWQPLKENPDYMASGSLNLRDYQIDGINFLMHAWHQGKSVILADEMGLGKTVQAITFLKYLFGNYGFKGPMLVCVPLSTLAAWQKEFETWAPEMNLVVYIGDRKSREIIRQYECIEETGVLIFSVLLTSYEMIGKDQDFFGSIAWSNIVIDEAHRLKNQNSLLYKVLIKITGHHRLLLTGTPLQNSLKELWCLLNFIQVPDLEPWDEFEMSYGSDDERELGYTKLHKLLKPFIIRRLKKDVEKSLPGKVERILRVNMTGDQKRLYKDILTRNFDVLSKGKNQVSLLNLMMQLRKTSNHSHLILEPEEIAQDEEERCKQLVYGSGKLLLLDKLLARFREKGDRVLIFSQMVTMLNIIEEYLVLKRYQFQRLDGSVNADERKQSIARFNNPESSDFCFLLSTKAGGVGINLQTANVIIIFDSDFNPQNDLQAIARAHRIGQKDEVKIFRLVASNSVDEEILQKAKNKMVLDHLVITRMDTTGQSVIGAGASVSPQAEGIKFSKEDLNMILKFGAEELFHSKEDMYEEEINVDTILKQAEVKGTDEELAGESEAEDSKKFLGGFKCTTLTFEETEKVEEMAGAEALDWNAIIPLESRPKNCKETSKVESLDRKLRSKRLKNINRNEESEDESSKICSQNEVKIKQSRKRRSTEISNISPNKRESSTMPTTWISQDILDEMLIKSETDDGSFKKVNPDILLVSSQNDRMVKSSPLALSPVGNSQRFVMPVPTTQHVSSSQEMTIITQQTMQQAFTKRKLDKQKENFKQPEDEERVEMKDMNTGSPRAIIPTSVKHKTTLERSDSYLGNDCVNVISQKEDVGGVKSLQERPDMLPSFPGLRSAALDFNQDRIPGMQQPFSPSQQIPVSKICGEMETSVDFQHEDIKDSNDCKTSPTSSPKFHGFPTSPHTSLQRNLDILDTLITLSASEISISNSDVIVIEHEDIPPSVTTATTKPDDFIKLCEYPIGQKGAVLVGLQDYATLDSETFINDIVIDFYIQYLQFNVLSAGDKDSLHIFSSMFYKRMMQVQEAEIDNTMTKAEKRHTLVAKWTKNVDIFNKKLVIVPICQNSHWFLIVAINPGNVNVTVESKGSQEGSSCLIVLDSIGYKQADAVDNLRAYFTCEWKNRKLLAKGPVEDFTISHKNMPAIYPNKPEQDDGVNCGIFLLHYVEKIFMDVLHFLSPNLDISNWFTQEDISKKRAKIAELIKKLDIEQNGSRAIIYPDIKLGH